MKGSEKAARVARHSNSWVPASAGMTLFGGEQSFGAAQIDAEEAADAFFDHGDAEQAVHAAHRHGVVGDDEVAGVGLGGPAVEGVADALGVRVVEGGGSGRAPV